MYHIFDSHICPTTWGNRIQMTQRWRNLLQFWLYFRSSRITYQALLIFSSHNWQLFLEISLRGFRICHSGLVLCVNLISVSLSFMLGKCAQSRLDLLHFQLLVIHQWRSLSFWQHTWIHYSLPLSLHRLAAILYINIPGWKLRFYRVDVACTRCITTQAFRQWNRSNLLVVISRLLVRIWVRKLGSFLISWKLGRYDCESLSFNIFLNSLVSQAPRDAIEATEAVEGEE